MRPAGLSSEEHSAGYTILGGARDAGRLARQARVMGEATEAFPRGRREGARRSDAEAGVAAEFVLGDGSVPLGRGAFDLAFSRLMLSHPIEPGWRSAPCATPCGRAALDRLQDPDSATARAWRRPDDRPPAPRDAGSDRPGGRGRAHRREPDGRRGREAVPGRAPRHMRPAMLGAGVATPGELDEVRAEVDGAAREPGTTFFQARMHQVHGRRPEA